MIKSIFTAAALATGMLFGSALTAHWFDSPRALTNIWSTAFVTALTYEFFDGWN